MLRKKCSVCKVEKPRSLQYFYARKAAADGMSPRCSDCDKAMCRRWRESNRGKLAADSREWRRNNPGRTAAKIAEWKANNKERYMAAEKEYRIANAGKRKESVKRWRKQNPDKVADGGKARRDARKRATPDWLTNEHKAQIRLLYKIRVVLNATSTIKYEVDHIVPLRNEKVCGLHVPWNLAVVTKEKNQTKRNYLEENNGAPEEEGPTPTALRAS